MAARGRGRGRNRGIKQENDAPMRFPESELIDRLVSQHGSGERTAVCICIVKPV